MNAFSNAQLAAMDRAGELPSNEMQQHFHNNQLGAHQVNMAETKEFFLKTHGREGEIYAGVLLGKDGEPDQHIFLLPGQANDVSWANAVKFAEMAGGTLPTRREQALLYANLPEQFDKRWYWSGEQRAGDPDSAWVQGFDGGGQDCSHKSLQFRARPVRRLP